MKPIGLLTTIDTNIGDDLIRLGVEKLFRAGLGTDVRFERVNKHHPWSVYPSLHPARLLKGASARMPRGRGRMERLASLATRLGASRFDGCAAVVQCGAPVLWPSCHACEWAEPIWRDVIGRIWEETPIANLAAGSCYPWEEQPKAVGDERDAEFLRRVASYCSLTTVRDSLAERLLGALGVEARRLPCTAFLSAPQPVSSSRGGKGVVLVNYMRGAGHYDWDQGIDGAGWEATVRQLLERLGKRHEVAFICHSEAEARLAEGLDPSVRRLRPASAETYFEGVENVAVAICNRIHAAVALASHGVPAMAIGTDTRLLMAREIGLPSFYVKDARANILEAEAERLIRDHESEETRLWDLRRSTEAAYLGLLEPVFERVRAECSPGAA